MELYQMRYFLKVAEELNFRRAAKQLYISQPALSQQINELEKELGIRLLYRDNQKVSLLPEGEIFYDQAKKIVCEVDKLIVYMQGIGKIKDTDLCIKIGFDKDEDGLTDSDITDAIFFMKEKYPNIKTELNYYLLDDFLEAVEKEALDIGFFILKNDEYENYKYRKEILWEDRLCLAAHYSLQGTAQELFEKYPLIQLKDDHRWEGIIQKKVKRICKRYQIKYVDSIMKSLNYVTIRDGIVPAILSQIEKEPGLRPIDTDLDIPEDKIVIAALWKKDNEWIDNLINEIKR